MSKNTLYVFLMLLKNGKWNRIINEYYSPNACVECISTQEIKDSNWLLKLFASAHQVLQYKVENIEITENRLSFAIHSVTKNKNNEIDFTEHLITSFWKNNAIQKHSHIVSTF